MHLLCIGGNIHRKQVVKQQIMNELIPVLSAVTHLQNPFQLAHCKLAHGIGILRTAADRQNIPHILFPDLEQIAVP